MCTWVSPKNALRVATKSVQCIGVGAPAEALRSLAESKRPLEVFRPAGLEQQIEKVKDLIKKEERVVKRSEDAKDKGIDELNKVADEQRDVRKQTESLASEMNNQDSGTKPGAKEMTEASQKQQQAEEPASAEALAPVAATSPSPLRHQAPAAPQSPD